MRRLFTLLTIPLLLSACGANLQGSVTPDGDVQEEQQQGEQPQENKPTLVEYQNGDWLALPGFSVAGKVMPMDGELIVVYEYDSDEAAEADQSNVSSDGQTVSSNAMAWAGPVHFFRHGRVMVVYVGSNEGLLEKLRADGGDQFAGN